MVSKAWPRGPLLGVVTQVTTVVAVLQPEPMWTHRDGALPHAAWQHVALVL